MSVTALKLLALCSMLCDHVIRIFPPDLLLPSLAERMEAAAAWASPAVWFLAEMIPHLLRYFGRLAAPVFLYALVSGFRHTSSRPRYAARLLIFALLSQGPYILFAQAEAAGYGGIPAGEVSGNILFTLLLGLLMLWGVETSGRERWPLAAVVAAGSMALSRLLDFEGRERYLLIILTLYFLTGKKRRSRWAELLLLLLVVALGRYRLVVWAITDPRARSTALLNILGPFLGLALALTCSGEKGRQPKWLQWGMYWFYPLHLLLLGVIGMALAG